MESLSFDIKFKFPHNLGSGEHKSKLIDPASDLYKFLEKVRNRIHSRLGSTDNSVLPKRMDFHIELVDSGASMEVMAARTKKIQEQQADVHKCYIYKKALCLTTPTMNDDGDRCKRTHITIAFCKDEISEEIRREMMAIILEEIRAHSDRMQTGGAVKKVQK